MSEVEARLAYIDSESGRVIIPLPARKLHRTDTEEHLHYKCVASLPAIEQNRERSLDISLLKSNRQVLAVIQPCCNRWFQPVRFENEFGYDSHWEWLEVGPLRRWWWRRKGWI